MSKIGIVTDSVACIPTNLVKKYDIHVAPVQIIWDRDAYRDGIDMTPNEFYARLRTSKTLPTTSSGIQGEFLQIFEGLRQKVDSIVTIVLTGALGASYSSACNAKEMVSDIPIEVIDTSTAMMAARQLKVLYTPISLQATGNSKPKPDAVKFKASGVSQMSLARTSALGWRP